MNIATARNTLMGSTQRSPTRTGHKTRELRSCPPHMIATYWRPKTSDHLHRIFFFAKTRKVLCSRAENCSKFTPSPACLIRTECTHKRSLSHARLQANEITNSSTSLLSYTPHRYVKDDSAQIIISISHFEAPLLSPTRHWTWRG